MACKFAELSISPREILEETEIGFTTEVTLLTELTDEQLLTQALAGERRCIHRPLPQAAGAGVPLRLHMSGSSQIAEEVTQDVFMFLLQRGHGFDPSRAALGAYLFGVARNYVRRALEHSYSESVLTDSGRVTKLSSLVIDHDPCEGIARHQASTAVWKAVLSLPEHYREVVVLCDLQECTYADAAEAMGCAIGTVRSRLHRAHDMLGKKLQHSAAAAPGINPTAARCLS